MGVNGIDEADVFDEYFDEETPVTTLDKTTSITKIDLLIFVGFMLTFGFALGWIFPVEGPIDYVYDEAIKQKLPLKAAPAQKKEMMIDLNNDGEMGLYYFMPFIEDKETKE